MLAAPLLAFDATQALAWCALGLVALVASALLVVEFRHSAYDFSRTILYFINKVFTRIQWRATISEPLPVEHGQGAVIVCNHTSGIDPLVIQLAAHRVVHWMVAREYTTQPAMAWVFRLLEVIPVNRGGIDTASTRHAIRLAAQGDLVGMFPEGRINRGEKLLLPGRPGAALVALKARVPIVPCYISGAPYDGTSLGSFLMTARVRLVVGPLLDISSYYGREKEHGVLEELTRMMLREIAALAGHPDFQPEIAGRHWKPVEAAAT